MQFFTMSPALQFGFVIFLAQFLASSNAAKAASADTKCLDMVQGVMESQLTGLVPCINEGAYTSPKDRAKNYNCIMKCMLSKAGVLSPSGQVSVIKALAFVLSQFPTDFVEKALSEISKCMEFASINVNDPNDKNCKGMKPLVQCGVDFIFNICK